MKEERIQYVAENRLGNMSVVGNAVMKCRNENIEKSFTEVIKIADRSDYCEECIQHKHGENEI